MSHRVGWRVTIAGLVEAGPEGREAVSGAVNELIEHGYLTRSQAQGEGGRFGPVEYELADPAANGFAASGETADGFAASGESAPKNTIKKEHHEKNTMTRGTRIPEPFLVDEQMRVWAQSEAPSVDLIVETKNFADHWATQSGSRGVKLDWVRVWQTWMRRQHGWNVAKGWKPEAQVRDVTVQQAAEQKARWCAARGITVEKWDSMSSAEQRVFASQHERKVSA
jgi:hypothetical protein